MASFLIENLLLCKSISGASCTFDAIGLKVEVLQTCADGWNLFQLVVGQVQLHERAHVKSIGWDSSVCELIVREAHKAQLRKLLHKVDGDGGDVVVVEVQLT